MENKKEKLIRILSTADDAISASALAGMLGVSERSIRNYVKDINQEKEIISASRNGYTINPDNYSKELFQASTPENDERVYTVISDLLSEPEGINAFEEADILYVSGSTVMNTIIPKIKQLIEPYNLKITSRNYQFVLEGDEKDKRKLIGYLASNNSYGFFNSNNALEQLFPNFSIGDLMDQLFQTCKDSPLYINDFALNNLLMHLLVIAIRLTGDNSLEPDSIAIDTDVINDYNCSEDIIDLADQIKKLFFEKFRIEIPEYDYKQILVLIALSVESKTLNSQTVLDVSFIQSIKKLLGKVTEKYCTVDFDDDFIAQFALHMYCAKQRYQFHVSYPNPISPQFKRDYVPVFDMAVYFAHKFDTFYKTKLSEDEIAFIAFHLGAYLANKNSDASKVTCTVVVENYHNFSKELIDNITSTFEDVLTVTTVMPLNQFMHFHVPTDLIISSVPIPVSAGEIVIINPIPTKRNYNDISMKIDEINERKQHDKTKAFLNRLFNPALYFKDLHLSDPTEYIQYLGNQCMQHELCESDFIEDVQLREKLSSTSFTDLLAVPHSLNTYAKKSFIAVVHNSAPIDWNGKNVNFIFMIGIAQEDMKYFQDAFELIINLFNDPTAVAELLKTKNFKEFTSKF